MAVGFIDHLLKRLLVFQLPMSPFLTGLEILCLTSYTQLDHNLLQIHLLNHSLYLQVENH